MSTIECFLLEFKINFIYEMILVDKKKDNNSNNGFGHISNWTSN